MIDDRLFWVYLMALLSLIVENISFEQLTRLIQVPIPIFFDSCSRIIPTVPHNADTYLIMVPLLFGIPND